MIHPTRHCHDIRQARRHVDLTVAIVAPRCHYSVRLQCQRMRVTRRHRHDIRQTRRHRDLADTVIAPSHHGAVGLQCERMSSACRHRHDISQSRRHRRLPLVIATPGYDLWTRGEDVDECHGARDQAGRAVGDFCHIATAVARAERRHL